MLGKVKPKLYAAKVWGKLLAAREHKRRPQMGSEECRVLLATVKLPENAAEGEM